MKAKTSPPLQGYIVPFYSTDELLRISQMDAIPSGAIELVDSTPKTRVSLNSDQGFERMFADRVRRARITPSIEKLRESLLSYESVANRMKAGMRIRKPGADDSECLSLVRAQLVTLRRLQERPVYMLIAGDGC